MNARRRCHRVAATAVVALSPGLALAQDAAPAAGAAQATPPAAAPSDLDEAVADLVGAEEVVITARRDPFVPLDWAGGRTIVGPEEMRNAGQNTLYDVLQRVPGVHVEEESGNDTKPNIALRGMRSERTTETTLLVDGIPLSPAPYGHPGISLFPFTMERAWAVDVIRSGFATRYGPNNVAGVINFLTPPIPDEPMAMERMRFAGDDYRSYYTVAGGTWGDFGFIAEDVRKSGDTYRDNGSFKVRNRGFKASWRTTPTSKILLQYDVYDDHSRLAGGLNDADYEKDPHQTKSPDDWFRGDQQRGNARWIWEPDGDTRLELLTYAYGSFREFWLGSPTQYDDSPTRFQSTPRRMTTAAVAPTFTKRFRVSDDVHNTVTVGVRYQRELIHTATDRLIVSTGVTEHTANQVHEYDTWAGWIEDTVRMFDRLSVTGGLRYESIDVDAKDRLTGYTVTEDISMSLPAVSASFDVTRDVAVFASRYEGFRSPAYSQVIPSPAYEGTDLETSRSWDAGTRAVFGDGALSVEATHFAINFDDRLITDPDDPDHQINAGEQKQWGWELGARSDLGRISEDLTGFHVYVTSTLLNTEQRSGDFRGNDLTDAPTQRWAWGASYLHTSGLRAGIDGVYVGESWGDASNEDTPDATGAVGINPSRTVWSARLGFDAAVDEAERWMLGIEVGMTNLFDTDGYNRFGSRGIVPIAPRTTYVGLSITGKF